LEIIRNKLPKLLDRHPNGITLFVWLGTCDLTEKYEDGFISLRTRTNSSVYKINSVFKQFYFLIKYCDNVKLVFIELPMYIQFTGGINSKDMPTQNNLKVMIVFFTSKLTC
jgi:hypothetical protein